MHRPDRSAGAHFAASVLSRHGKMKAGLSFIWFDGLARIAGIYNASIFDDILNATMPIENDMGENIINMSKNRKHEE